MAEKYSCNNCGSVMLFNADTQGLKCPSCDSTTEIQLPQGAVIQEHQYTQGVATALAVKPRSAHTMECCGCGAHVEVDATSTATKCPYCDSDYVLSQKQVDSVLPDGIIPFAFGKNEANNKFGNWIKKLFWAPNNLKNIYKQDKLQGIYIPFWTFDAQSYAQYTAQGGTDHTRRRKGSDGKMKTETYTTWDYTQGQVSHFFNDNLVPASTKLDKGLIQRFSTYDTNKLVPYSPEFLSGFNAECYTVNIDTAQQIAHEQMKNYLLDLATQDVRSKFDRAKDVRLEPQFDKETFKHVILPVYATAFAYANKMYNVLINGQTGEIEGAYPISKLKVAAAIGIGALAAILLYFMFFS